MSVRWAAAARFDVVRLVSHIDAENPIAARRVARELLLAADSLTMFPYRGRIGLAPGTREIVAIVPYVIVYEIDAAGDVLILRVWHGAQNRF